MGGLMVLEEARAAGLRVWTEGDRLKVRGPRAAADLALRLLARKAEVMAALEPKPAVTPWPPRPAELARWPVSLRQRWGERANALEATGLSWREAERRAFDEIKAEAEAGPDGRSSLRHTNSTLETTTR